MRCEPQPSSWLLPTESLFHLTKLFVSVIYTLSEDAVSSPCPARSSTTPRSAPGQELPLDHRPPSTCRATPVPNSGNVSILFPFQEYLVKAQNTSLSRQVLENKPQINFLFMGKTHPKLAILYLGWKKARFSLLPPFALLLIEGSFAMSTPDRSRCTRTAC